MRTLIAVVAVAAVRTVVMVGCGHRAATPPPTPTTTAKAAM